MPLESAVRPWYREPMVWLVAGIPLTSVIVGITLLTLAIRSGSADAVPDPVRRTLQIQDTDIAADREAIALGLRGELQVDPDTGALLVRLAPLPAEATPTLVLRLLHAGRASLDQELSLVRSGDQWLGRVDKLQGQAWNIEVAATDGSWRVGGRLDPGARSSELIPMLAEG